MPPLAEMQADFAAALADPTRAAPVGPDRRFDVHRNNRMVSLIEALETSFPVVHRLVGNDFFRAAAKIYIRRWPPRSPVLLLYGESFGDFLENFEPAQGVPYLGDVARLEWARLKAFHAADAEPLSAARLAAVPPQDLAGLRFALHPSLQLLASRWPVASIWADEAADMAVGQQVAVIRPTLSVELRVLPPGGHAFLAALAAGATLGEAAETALASHPDFDLSAHLQGLFALGAVTALLLPTPETQET